MLGGLPVRRLTRRLASPLSDYNAGSQRENPRSLTAGTYKCMFLCKVAEGASHRSKRDRLDEFEVDSLIAARGQGAAHDSIVGVSVADGGAINHEETVVYTNEAAIPSYLIVYRMP